MKKNLSAITVKGRVVDVCDNNILDREMEQYIRYHGNENISSVSLEEVIKAPDTDIEAQVTELISACKCGYEVYSDSGRLSIEISWGDWRHDHQFVDELIFKTFGLSCHSNTVTEENGDDSYSSIHTYIMEDKA